MSQNIWQKVTNKLNIKNTSLTLYKTAKEEFINDILLKNFELIEKKDFYNEDWKEICEEAGINPNTNYIFEYVPNYNNIKELRLNLFNAGALYTTKELIKILKKYIFFSINSSYNKDYEVLPIELDTENHPHLNLLNFIEQWSPEKIEDIHEYIEVNNIDLSKEQWQQINNGNYFHVIDEFDYYDVKLYSK